MGNKDPESTNLSQDFAVHRSSLRIDDGDDCRLVERSVSIRYKSRSPRGNSYKETPTDKF